jgi:hypothetical protein
VFHLIDQMCRIATPLQYLVTAVRGSHAWTLGRFCRPWVCDGKPLERRPVHCLGVRGMPLGAVGCVAGHRSRSVCFISVCGQAQPLDVEVVVFLLRSGCTGRGPCPRFEKARRKDHASGFVRMNSGNATPWALAAATKCWPRALCVVRPPSLFETAGNRTVSKASTAAPAMAELLAA